MIRPVAVLRPVSTGSEMKLERKPSLRIRASSRKLPASNASVDAAAISLAGSPSGTTRASSLAVRIAIMAVILKLTRADVPIIAYTSIGTRAVYRPTSSGSPAMAA